MKLQSVLMCCMMTIGLAVSGSPSISDDQLDGSVVALSTVQEQALAYIDQHSKRKTSGLPKSDNSLVAWFSKRYEVSATKESLYALAGDGLRVARALLLHKNQYRRRQGLRLGILVSNLVGGDLEDRWLQARIYEGFLLPNLTLAYKQTWQDLSQQRLLEGAAAAFSQASEEAEQLRVLRALLKLSTNQNTKDWTHGQVAQVLASQKKYAEAITHLKAINSSSMSGMKSLLAEYEKKLHEQHIPTTKEENLKGTSQ